MQKKNYINWNHLVEFSPWPMSASICGLSLTLGGIKYWHKKKLLLLKFGVLTLIVVSFLWWNDVKYESYLGYHKIDVVKGLQLGMMLFIMSEVLFFFSFFWSYFHNLVSPSLDVGGTWPPKLLKSYIMDPFSMPLLKTMLLLSSGVSMTWSHHKLIKLNKKNCLMGLFMTMVLGFSFLFMQVSEYMDSLMSMKWSVYGSVFFILTGFHGLHVTIGAIFLTICLIRMLSYTFTKNSHVGFLMCAWYWHFVDVVWMFLYVFLYWYGFSG